MSFIITGASFLWIVCENVRGLAFTKSFTSQGSLVLLGALSQSQQGASVSTGCSLENQYMRGPLLNTLVIVLRDSYNHVDNATVRTQVHAVENTWGSWMPHLLYLVQNDSSKLPLKHRPVHEYLRADSYPDTLWSLASMPSNHSFIVFGGADMNLAERETFRWKIILSEAKQLPHIEWLLLATLQTYVIAPNLCMFLSKVQSLSEKPVLMGRPLLGYGQRYPTAFPSAGMLFSWSGFIAFANYTRRFEFVRSRISHDLSAAGVFVRDTRDEYGRERFHIFNLVGEAYRKPRPPAQTPRGWFVKFAFYGYHQGLECCAATSISFHYFNPSEHVALQYALKKTARLRANSFPEADLTEEVFGPSWTTDPAINEYGYVWRDSKYLLHPHHYNNTLVRELIANRIRLGEQATWHVSRTLQEPVWIHASWKANFNSTKYAASFAFDEHS